MIVATASAPAAAHAALVSPIPRTSGNSDIKNCPCGPGTGGMRCENGVSSDPNRSNRATTYAAGQTITVEFDEYIGHTGRIRVAFDPDGADLADFNDHVLADIADPSGDGGRKTVQVTLPDTPCTNCTLQLVQVMNGNTRDRVGDPTGFSTYYDCADLVLVRAGEGEGEGDPPPGGEGEGEGETSGPPVGEGEGDPPAPVGEGEGEGPPVGEGEGEGDDGVDAPTARGATCASSGIAAPVVLVALLRRGRRR